MTEFTIAELAIPREVGADGWDDYLRMCEVRNAVEEAMLGTRELALEPEEMLPHFSDPNDLRRVWVARIGREIVGRGVFGYTNKDSVAWLNVEVTPDFRNRGIGGALSDAIREAARVAGKTTLQTDFFSSRNAPGPRLTSPSGFGSVPALATDTRFATSRGYGLELVLRLSRLELPVEPERLARNRAAAEESAGSNYRVLRWEGRTPEDRIDDFAILRGRMFTDAPHGNLDVGKEVWDAQRVREMEDVEVQAGRLTLIAAIEHIPSRTLVAFNELTVPTEVSRTVHQRDTLVLAEHRGHRLGMLLKVDNIQALTEAYPGHPSIVTFNAEENEHMLAVNEAVGFVAVAHAGVWKYEAAG